MSSLLLSLGLDALVAVLLSITIVYCSKLSRRIREMQDSRSELAEMITRFDQATDRATTSLAELQNVSKRITDALQMKIEKANFLADDLAFLIEKSAKSATQLEQAKKQPRPEPVAEKPKPAPVTRPYFETAAVQIPKPVEQPITPSIQDIPQSKVAASLEAVLARLASSGRDTSAGSPAPAARTHAERELIQALKSGS